MFVFSTVHGWRYVFVFSTVCGGKHCFDTRQNNPVGLRYSSRWWFHCQNKCSKFKSAWMKIHVHILNSSWMKICVRILKCMEENTVLTKGRIILWAGGSLADDGSTVSKQVFLYSTVHRWRYVFVFSTVCVGKHCFDTRQNNPVGRR